MQYQGRFFISAYAFQSLFSLINIFVANNNSCVRSGWLKLTLSVMVVKKGYLGYKNGQTFTLIVFEDVVLATISKTSVNSKVKFMIC